MSLVYDAWTTRKSHQFVVHLRDGSFLSALYVECDSTVSQRPMHNFNDTLVSGSEISNWQPLTLGKVAHSLDFEINQHG